MMEWAIHRMLRHTMRHSLVLLLSLCLYQTFADSQPIDSQRISKFSKLLDELRLLKKERETYSTGKMPDLSALQSGKHTLNSKFGLLKNADDDKGQLGYFLTGSNSLLNDLTSNDVGEDYGITKRLNLWGIKSGSSSNPNSNWNNKVTSDNRKRQGSWDFDYGLGGGRFGKRGLEYKDYPLGGGRFGRDVDHIDHIDIDIGE